MWSALNGRYSVATEPWLWVSACDFESPGRQGSSASMAGRLESSLVQGLSLPAW